MKEVRIDLLRLLGRIGNDEKSLVRVVRRWLKLLSANPRTTFYNGSRTTVIALEDISLIQTIKELSLRFKTDLPEDIEPEDIYLVGRYVTPKEDSEAFLTDILGLGTSKEIGL